MMPGCIMDGVWVLNINHGQQGGDIATYIGVGALIGCLIGILALLLIYFADRLFYNNFADFMKDDIAGKILIIAVFALFGISCGAAVRPITSETTYDVMIGDNVQFNEFTEQYEIIEQNGNIYTVKERTK